MTYHLLASAKRPAAKTHMTKRRFFKTKETLDSTRKERNKKAKLKHRIARIAFEKELLAYEASQRLIFKPKEYQEVKEIKNESLENEIDRISAISKLSEYLTTKVTNIHKEDEKIVHDLTDKFR